MTTAGNSVTGLPYTFACRNVAIASSLASNARSRTIGLKPWNATFGPQKSKLTRSDLTAPDLSAFVTA